MVLSLLSCIVVVSTVRVAVVFGAIYNAALYQTTTQSSNGTVFRELNSELAVSLQTSMQGKTRYCSTTMHSDLDPYWMLELDKSVYIYAINITTSIDYPLSSLLVEIGCLSGSTTCFETCFQSFESIPAGETIQVQCNNPVFRQRVRIRSASNSPSIPLSLCEVSVYDIGLRRKAVRITEQSSVGSSLSFPSWLAVDGNNDTQQQEHGYCSATKSSRNPWWEVDLGSEKAIDSITITESNDCCGGVVQYLIVEVKHMCGTEPSQVCAEVCTSHQRHPGSVTLTCSQNVTGQFVIISLDGNGILTLCEVQVWVKAEMTQTVSMTTMVSPTANVTNGPSKTYMDTVASPLTIGTTTSGSPTAISMTTMMVDRQLTSQTEIGASQGSSETSEIQGLSPLTPDTQGYSLDQSTTTKAMAFTDVIVDLTDTFIVHTPVPESQQETIIVLSPTATQWEDNLSLELTNIHTDQPNTIEVSNPKGPGDKDVTSVHTDPPNTIEVSNPKGPVDKDVTSMQTDQPNTIEVSNPKGPGNKDVTSIQPEPQTAAEMSNTDEVQVQASSDLTYVYTTLTPISEVAELSQAFTTQIGTMTVMCSCYCKSPGDSGFAMSFVDPLQLLLDKRTVSKFKRRFYSAPDDRPSAISIGSTGILCLVFVFGLFVLSDVDYVVRARRKPKKQ